jgi:lipopolysaccharide transport system permease protein
MKRTGLTSSDPVEMPSEPARTGIVAALLRPMTSVWERRVLFRRVLRRDIEASFRGSALGVLWIVLIPLAMVAVYTFVFGVILQSAWQTADVPPTVVPLIYFCGIVIFGFFIEVVNRSPNHIRSNATYVKKVIFPLDLLDWVLVGSAATRLAVGLLLLAVFIIIVQQRLPVEMLLLPVLLAPVAVMMLGVAWILSAIGTYVRDLGHMITVVSPVIMFVSPVFYSLQQVPEAFRGIYMINPMSFPLEHARQILFFGQGIPWADYGLYWLAAIVVFYAGYLFFQRARPGFADVV